MLFLGHFCGCLVITVAAKGRFFPSHVSNLRSQRSQIIVSRGDSSTNYGQILGQMKW